jgi:CheR methyltransferase, SAM binding domain/CheR methyltransferase, all-alpha domain
MIGDLEFTFIRNFLMQRTGIQLTTEKRYLVETRLDPVMRQFQLPSFSAVVQRLKTADRVLEVAVVDAMTTNETLFFRDKQPFDLFQNEVMPQLIASRRNTGRIRIWCAACSSGQEPYSLSMILDEMKPKLHGMQVEIVATDISERALQPVRGAARSADPLPAEAFHTGRGALADQQGDGRAYPVQIGESDAGLQGAGAIRHHFLPQRSDLLRRTDQARCAGPDE